MDKLYVAGLEAELWGLKKEIAELRSTISQSLTNSSSVENEPDGKITLSVRLDTTDLRKQLAALEAALD